MDLLQLTYFLSAAQTENFSRTAQRFQVPPSNISQMISRLEQELGVALFERSANSVRLSDAGKLYYGHVKSALDSLEEGRRALRDPGSALSGTLNILAHTSRSVLTRAIERFRAQYPDVSFRINHASERCDEFDLILSDAPFDDRLYVSRPVLTEKILLALRRDHPLAQKRPLSIEDLRGESFVTMPTGGGLYRITHRLCASAGFVPNIAIQCEDPYYIRRYVAMGLGIAFVPSVSWRGLFSDDVALLDAGPFERRVYLVRRRCQCPGRAAQLFEETLAAAFAESQADNVK